MARTVRNPSPQSIERSADSSLYKIIASAQYRLACRTLLQSRRAPQQNIHQSSIVAKIIGRKALGEVLHGNRQALLINRGRNQTEAIGQWLRVRTSPEDNASFFRINIDDRAGWCPSCGNLWSIANLQLRILR